VLAWWDGARGGVVGDPVPPSLQWLCRTEVQPSLRVSGPRESEAGGRVPETCRREGENRRLKPIVGDQGLNLQGLKETLGTGS